ncbi:MAG: sugar ABC transporter permease [Thermodesulfobacteriota bacterium]
MAGLGVIARERRAAFLFTAPAIFCMAVVAFYPILWALYLSLHRRLPIFGISKFIGLRNYIFLAQDTRFWNAFFNTLYFTLVSVALEFILGLAIALVLHQAFRGRGWVRAAVLIPWAIPTVVSARMWEWIYNSDFGVLNYLLVSASIISTKLNWLGDSALAMHAAIMVDVWKTTPFVALLLLAGLQFIPQDLYRAAQVDGAGPLTSFRHITLPMLKPAILVVLLFRTLDAFRIFDAVYILTGGGPANTTETLSIYSYKLLFQTLQFGYGSAVAVVTFVSVMVISFFYIRVLAGVREG